MLVRHRLSAVADFTTRHIVRHGTLTAWRIRMQLVLVCITTHQIKVSTELLRCSVVSSSPKLKSETQSESWCLTFFWLLCCLTLWSIVVAIYAKLFDISDLRILIHLFRMIFRNKYELYIYLIYPKYLIQKIWISFIERIKRVFSWRRRCAITSPQELKLYILACYLGHIFALCGSTFEESSTTFYIHFVVEKFPMLSLCFTFRHLGTQNQLYYAFQTF